MVTKIKPRRIKSDNPWSLWDFLGYQDESIFQWWQWWGWQGNVKAFYFDWTSADNDTAEEVLDWYLAWKTPIIQEYRSAEDKVITHTIQWVNLTTEQTPILDFRSTYAEEINTTAWYSYSKVYTIAIWRYNWIHIQHWFTYSPRYIDPWHDYTNAYMPTHNSNPATKKYVDNNDTYIWTSAPTDNLVEWKLWYDTINDVLKVYNWSNWEIVWDDTSNINVKTFFISGQSEYLAVGQQIYDRIEEWNYAIINYANHTYILAERTSTNLLFKEVYNTVQTHSNNTQIWEFRLNFIISSGTVVDATAWWYSLYTILDTSINYSTPYTPQYDWSPATKKYVDDNIAELMWLWKFLSLRDSSTGQPLSFPLSTPYTYSTWDYYLVEVVDTTTNYRPNGSSYTWTASSIVETDELEIWDVYIYDWTVWLLQSNHWKTVSFWNIAWDPYDNTNLSQVLNAKQDVLTAWANITIDPVTNEISANNTTYSNATSAVAWIVKLWSDTVISEAIQSPAWASNKTYPVQLNSSGQMWVNVPRANTTYWAWIWISIDANNDIQNTWVISVNGSTWAVTVPVWDVVWPASSTDGHLAVFDGATGKLIKDWWAVPTWVPAVWTNWQILTVVSWVAAWANAPASWIQNDTTWTTTTVTKIWAWTEAEYNALSSHDANTIYHIY